MSHQSFDATRLLRDFRAGLDAMFGGTLDMNRTNVHLWYDAQLVTLNVSYRVLKDNRDQQGRWDL